MEKIDAWKLCGYRDGKAPRIIREVLDREFAPLPSEPEPALGDEVMATLVSSGDCVTGIVSGLRLRGGRVEVSSMLVNEIIGKEVYSKDITRVIVMRRGKRNIR